MCSLTGSTHDVLSRVRTGFNLRPSLNALPARLAPRRHPKEAPLHATREERHRCQKRVEGERKNHAEQSLGSTMWSGVMAVLLNAYDNPNWQICSARGREESTNLKLFDKARKRNRIHWKASPELLSAPGPCSCVVLKTGGSQARHTGEFGSSAAWRKARICAGCNA